MEALVAYCATSRIPGDSLPLEAQGLAYSLATDNFSILH